MRTPAGFFPANELVAHVVMAGCQIVCPACGDEGFGAAVEEFLERHRLCLAAGEGVRS